MNFAQMLLAPAPMPLMSPEKPPPKPNTWSDIRIARKHRHKITVEKYAKAIGDGWAGTRDIENRMGTNRGCIYKVLMVYCDAGILERRPAGGTEFNRNKGWEWRVK